MVDRLEVRGSVVTPVRDHLAKELASKLQRYGVVIWDDREQSYGAVAGEIAPEGVSVATFDGSWFALRRDIEAQLTGATSPNLLVYVSAPAPENDPLEELRAIGVPYRSLLPTVIRNSLRGQLTDQRLEELGKQCQTLAEVEAALDAGASEADTRLMTLVGESGTAAIARALLSGPYDEQLSEPVLLDAAHAFFAKSTGAKADVASGAALRSEVFRHFVLTALHEATGMLPDDFTGAFAPVTAPQRKTVNDTWGLLRALPDSSAAIVELANEADSALHTAAVMTWQDGMSSIDLTPGIEELALLDARRLLGERDWHAASALAEERLQSSWWAQPNRLEGHDFHARWRAVAAIAGLNAALEIELPAAASLASVVDWYSSTGWEVDSAYRRMELLRVSAGTDLHELDEAFGLGRHRYEQWLDQVLRRTAEAISSDANVPDHEHQRRIHHAEVRGRNRTAYVLVDALRYELGRDLATRLGRLNATVDVRAVVAAAPTITPIGMAAVTPGAEERFDIDLNADSRLAVYIQGRPVRTVSDRVNRFEKVHGKVADTPLDKLAQYTNRELKKHIEGASLVLVRSTEIDADGETDQLAASWGSFDSTLDVLQTAVARLLHAGIRRVVLTADHGFLAVRELGEELRVHKPPTGMGESHRRAWIGTGGTATDSTVKVPLSDFGIGGGLDIIAPRGLGVFVASGGLQFFHGGLSPQELVVPVITVESDTPTAEPKYEIELSVAGGRITTGVVAVTIQMTGDLFTSESPVRVVLSQNGKRIARVVGGDGFDPVTGTIDAAVDKSQVITMRISENLAAGSVAMLEVLDASTGIRLGDAVDIDVAAHVMVQEEL
ncbi:MAG: PglZ domain-containing protein [Acidimicrobiaceae bacterium]|nr:PglZ domain-containing protein [Acidimicrobiaceae bacterium]